MMTNEKDLREDSVMIAARAIMSAARTAPKACGVDNLEIAVMSGRRKDRLAESMRAIGERDGRAFFLRDAANVDAAQAVVLIGSYARLRGLNCGMCGYPTCAQKSSAAPAVPCSFDVTDLGIAVGSAVSLAADMRIDNRVLFSAGAVARELELLPGCSIIYAIPLSVSGKSIFFDRK